MLSEDFRFRAQMKIIRKVRDGDGDGFIFDGTPRQRPVTPRLSRRVTSSRTRRPAPKKRSTSRSAPKKRAAPKPVSGTHSQELGLSMVSDKKQRGHIREFFAGKSYIGMHKEFPSDALDQRSDAKALWDVFPNLSHLHTSELSDAELTEVLDMAKQIKKVAPENIKMVQAIRFEAKSTGGYRIPSTASALCAYGIGYEVDESGWTTPRSSRMGAALIFDMESIRDTKKVPRKFDGSLPHVVVSKDHETVTAVFAHEVGHALHLGAATKWVDTSDMKLESSKLQKVHSAMWMTARHLEMGDARDAKSKVSKYADESIDEFIAENFAAFILGLTTDESFDRFIKDVVVKEGPSRMDGGFIPIYQGCGGLMPKGLSEDFRHRRVMKARPRKKPKHPVDADSDGRVYDNTPRERPAIPNVETDLPGKPGRRMPKGPKKPKGREAVDGPDKPKGPRPIDKPQQIKSTPGKPPKKQLDLSNSPWAVDRKDGTKAVGARVTVSDGREDHVMNLTADDYNDMRHEIELLRQQGWRVKNVQKPVPPKDRTSTKLQERDAAAAEAPSPKDGVPSRPTLEPPRPSGRKLPEGVDPATGEKLPDTPEPKKPSKGGPGHFDKIKSGEVKRVGSTSKHTSSGGSEIYEADEDVGVPAFVPGKGETNKRVTFVKTVFDDDAFDGRDAALSEQMGTMLYNDMGYNLPDVDVDWEGDSPRVAQGHTGQHRGKDMRELGSVGRFGALAKKVQDQEQARNQPLSLGEWADTIDGDKRGQTTVKLLQQSEDPGAVLRLAFHDFLTFQQDRHDGNLLIDPTTGEIAPFDFDWGFTEGLVGSLKAAKLAAGESIDDIDLEDAPVDWEEWMQFRGVHRPSGNHAAMLHALGAAALDYDTDRIRAELDRALEEASRIKPEEVRDRLAATGMPDDMVQKAYNELLDFQDRIQYMREDADMIVEALAG